MPDAAILIVDDEKEICELLADWLTQDGQWSVDYTTEPRRALEQVSQGGYDLMITDLRMPQMDGLALAREARGLQPDLGVIAITGYGSISSSVEALRLGAADYLQKPFRVEDVRAAVFRALANRGQAASASTEDDESLTEAGESAADQITHDNAVLSARNAELAKRLELVSRDLTLLQQRLAGHVADLEMRCDVSDLLEGQRRVDQIVGTALMVLRKRLPGAEHAIALLERRPARVTALATIDGADVVMNLAEHPLSRGLLRAVLKRSQPALIEDLATSAVLGDVKKWITCQGSLLVLPLVGNGRVRAVAIVRRDETGTAFGTNEVQRILPLCLEVGRALDVAQAMNRQQQHTFECLKQIAESPEQGEASGHARRLTHCVVALGREIGLPEDRIDVLKQAAALHDIGGIFNGPEHGERGWLLLRPLRFLRDAAELIRTHHGVVASPDVSLAEQQVLAAAEGYDELTHDGPHGPAQRPDEALATLRRACAFNDDILRAMKHYAVRAAV